MKSLLSLVLAVLENAGLLCAVDVQHDLRTVMCRSTCEGEEFLTVALPRFGASFEEALDHGECASVSFPGFRKRGGYPLFLGGMLKRVFSDKGLRLADNPDVATIQAIRQVCGIVGKIFEVCEPKFEKLSLDSFVRCEEDLEEMWISPQLLDALASAVPRYFGDELSSVENHVYRRELLPRHGPGSTADRLLGNKKFDMATWSERLESNRFELQEYGVPGWDPHYLDRFEILRPEAEPPVKVVSVPKSARKARIIAIEPTYRQWAQQGLLWAFASNLQGSTLNLSSQDPNRDLAMEGSSTGNWATLDLSEASDRVLLSVVEAAFKRFPHTLALLKASRGTTALLPDGRIIPLRKFASMGSAVCFPVESIVFASMAMLAIEDASNRSSGSSLSIKDLRRMVRVFGDDIIVPTRFADDVLRILVAFGNKPNPTKTFSRGLFRESCGGEYFAGHDVTIAKCRRRMPRSHRDCQEILSLVSLRNHLYMRGFWLVAGRIDERLSQLRVPMPIVEETSPIMGRRSVAFKPRALRFHPDYQTPLTRGLMVRNASPLSTCSAQGALMKCLDPRKARPFHDRDHLKRSGRPHRVRTKVGWGQIF